MLTKKESYSNIQKELLKIYDTNVPDDVLVELKNNMARFFLLKMRAKADKIWFEKNFTDELLSKAD
ncbi:MAG: hypothetical protein EAZ51_04755 [Sphingobacteriales bacterium]|jgi:hypothetical protein|nr:MAG: hypothetical protein EAZ64_04485 [Sphingobacteriales bacterium]TAF81152.1 MAG: hypothetical protein EAZ51_04755 [Sphingobacteriales bacterium]